MAEPSASESGTDPAAHTAWLTSAPQQPSVCFLVRVRVTGMRIRQSRSDSHENSIIIFRTRIELAPAGRAQRAQVRRRRAPPAAGWFDGVANFNLVTPLALKECFTEIQTDHWHAQARTSRTGVDSDSDSESRSESFGVGTTNPQRFGPHSGIRPVLDHWQTDSGGLRNLNDGPPGPSNPGCPDSEFYAAYSSRVKPEPSS